MNTFDPYRCPDCGQSTYSPRMHKCPVKPSEPRRPEGWLCPACGKGNAPWVSQCRCEGGGKASKADETPVCDKCKGTGLIIESNAIAGGYSGFSQIVKRCPNGCSSPITYNDQTASWHESS